MATHAERFETKVDRSGDHHLWTGTRTASGTGQVRIAGRLMTAHRAAWELANGALPPGAQVAACSASRACVRLDHLRVVGKRPTNAAPLKRSAKGSGSKVEVRPGVWKLTVNNRRYTDGSVRRVHRTVHVESGAEATRELAKLVAEVAGTKQAASKQLRDITLDEAIERFVVEHLLGEKGRDERTADGYRRLHEKWFSPELGHRRVRDLDEAGIDKAFGRMRRAGLSRSRLNQAKSLYSPFFRWAKRRQIITRNPMAEFQLPTSRQVSHERTPPEVEELCLLLATAVEVVPEVAPILALGAVTGMRRGELVGLRRSRVLPRELRLTVDSAVAGPGRLKATKTRRERSLFIDRETMTMLETHCAEMDARAALFGVEVSADGFVFSLAPDCAIPIPPDYVTKRVAILKERLGIADKRPETIVLEDEALRLFRQPRAARPAGRTGPSPTGALTYEAIGVQLARSAKWAALAVASAERREVALADQPTIAFDGSILALRKFTSSELLDAGFNISAVAQRQGHGPQVLMKHYAKARRSSDRKAAEHLGRVVHRDR